MARNLIVLCAGDGSVHRGWLAGRRNFDLYVSYFGDRPGTHRAGADYYRARAGFKWPVLARVLAEEAALLARYDCVAFPDEDQAGTGDAWSTCFDVFHAARLDLAAPSVTGPTSYPSNRPEPGCACRLTSFVEIQAPMFGRRALWVAGPTFGRSVSGWGLDVLWSALLPYPAYRLGVVDAASLEHTRPVGGGVLYRRLREAGVNPVAEWRALCDAYRVPFQPVLREYARYVRRPGPSNGNPNVRRGGS